MEEPAYAELALAVLACLVLHYMLADFCVACILGKVGDITVHVAVDLNALDNLVAVGLQPAVEVV